MQNRAFISGFLAVVLACLPCTVVGAQNPPTAIDEEIEEVVVTARRIEGSGSKRRLAASREELEQTDQTSMEGFFDEIDGLSTLGADGEGNAFSLNGLSADLTNVTLNGQSFGEGRGNNGFGAGDLPPDMIRRVDVYKTPVAWQEEGGSGGSVNLQLRNPVEMGGQSANARGRLAYVPDKENFSPSASFFTGRPSENRKFGYMLNLSLADRTREYGSQDIQRWLLADFDGTAAYYPSQIRNNATRDEESSIFAGTTLGFRPSDSLDVRAHIMLSGKLRNIESFGLMHRLEKQREITALAFDGRIVSELESSDKSRKNLRISGSTRSDKTESVVLGVDFTWRKSAWRVDGALGYNNDVNSSDEPSQAASFEANAAYSYLAGRDGSLSMSYPDGFPSNPAFSISRINLSDRRTEDNNGVAGLDVIRQLGDGFFRRIRFGAKARDVDRSKRNDKGRLNLDEDMSLEDFFTGQYQQTPWDTDKWPSSNMDRIKAITQAGEVDWTENLLNEYDMQRQTLAGYVQADFRSMLATDRILVGNIGARFVDTTTEIDGYQGDEGVLEPVTVNTDYTDLLPSLSMRMRIAERAALSLGAARVMTHPSFNDLAPGIRYNYSTKTARAGNPYLEPFRANQYMAELVWAPLRGQRIRANITYRDVESYFALGEESIEIDDDVFLLTRPINGQAGYILSAGVQFDPNLRRILRSLQDFDLVLAYTHNRSGSDMHDPYTGRELPLPNTAEYVAKADLVYSKNTFSGRLSYQWRGQSLKASSSDSGLSVWNRPVGSLNLNLGWQLNKSLQFNLDGRNLLAEDQLQTTDDDGQIWRITERDRMVAATLRARW